MATTHNQNNTPVQQQIPTQDNFNADNNQRHLIGRKDNKGNRGNPMSLNPPAYKFDNKMVSKFNLHINLIQT